MEFNRKNVRMIMLIIVFTVILLAAVLNIGALLGFISSVLGVFSTVFAGLAIAFVLNVPLRIFENRTFYGLREHRSPLVRRALRPVAIVSSLLITLGVLIVLLLVILPRLVETVDSLLRKTSVQQAVKGAGLAGLQALQVSFDSGDG